MTMSLAQQVATLGDEEREEALEGLDQEELLWDWNFWSRGEQVPPPGDDWAVWIYLAGRGAGKTRAAGEWIRDKARREIGRYPDLRFTLLARTAADVRDVIVEGESGILHVSPPSERPEWFPSKRRLVWPNGAQAVAVTADEPESLRGIQSHFSWADELTAHRQMPDQMGLTAWAHLRISTRLGENPQIVCTTTPRKVPVIRELLRESADHPGRVLISRGTTLDNAGNLSPSYMETLLGTYEGTRIARQEIYGELLDDVEGALWSEEMIDASRVTEAPQGLAVRVVGVDPTVAERPGDACGIVVVLGTAERETFRRQAWVVEDLTVQGSPEVWASRVVRAARKWGAPVVAEVNQGGALVRAAIHGVDPGVTVLEVRAAVGKMLRAEPVALAYEQGRVHHLGVLAELETEMTTWEPGFVKSPDRVDALVHALAAVLVNPPAGLVGGRLVARTPGRGKEPRWLWEDGAPSVEGVPVSREMMDVGTGMPVRRPRERPRRRRMRLVDAMSGRFRRYL